MSWQFSVSLCVSLPFFVCVTCREKEEDLEKRQFFLNRELRPLMEIPGKVYKINDLVTTFSSECMGGMLSQH